MKTKKKIKNITPNAEKVLTIKNDTEGYSTIFNLKRSVFALKNTSVFGNPVISEDGILSGLSQSNYLQTPNFSITNIRKMIVKWKGIYSSVQNSSSTNTQLFWQMRNGWRAEYTGNSIRLNGVSNKPNINISLSDGDVIEMECIIDITESKTTLNLSVNEHYYTATTSNTITLPSVVQYINISTPSSSYYWTGLTDLKFFSVNIDGINVNNFVKTGEIQIGSEHVPYVQAKGNAKVLDSQYRNLVQEYYNNNGKELLYTIDESDKTYTLPYKTSLGLEVINKI